MGLSRGDRNIEWIERYCIVPDGKLVGQPVKLRPWQKKIIRGIYGSPTRIAIVSFGRKNGKTSLAACLLLLHLCGPESLANAQLCSTALARKQAAHLHAYAAKMIRQSPDLRDVCLIRDSLKEIACPARGTLYTALSADAETNLGGSIAFAVHDELGQVRGPRSPLYEAIETASGAHEAPLSVIISTQAPTDADLLSLLIDDASTGADPRNKVWLWTADNELDPFGTKAKRAANPALGDFLNRDEVDKQAEDARRIPSRESSYRNLVLNQRVETMSPFVSRIVWKENGQALSAPLDGREVYAGLDLSAVADLTGLVAIAPVEDSDAFDVESEFWLPADGLPAKSRHDRVPYDLWAEQKFLTATPGRAIRYDFVATQIRALFDRCAVQKLAFDRYNMKFLKPELERAGFTEDELAERFVEFGQGFISMGPAVRELESLLLNRRLRHAEHPVLTMCMMNARTVEDPARNRKFIKGSPTARIDGAVCLAMAVSVARSLMRDTTSIYESRGALLF